MNKQPEALRLATKMDLMLGWDCCKEAAAELRRLHAENEELKAAQTAALSHPKPETTPEPSTGAGWASQPAEPAAWLVCSVNSDGSLSLEHAAAWEEAAHEHINDAITEHGIEEAATWVVRPAYTSALSVRSAPLTSRQIKEIMWACNWDRMSTCDERVQTNAEQLAAFVRAVEAAHGITKGPAT